MGRIVSVVVGVAVALLTTSAPSGAVTGGVPAKPGEYPFMVAIVSRHDTAFDGQFCGGTLVAPRWVLTAAHCVSNHRGIASKPASMDVVMGRVTLSERGGERIHVAEVRIDPSRVDPENDIDVALLHLDRPAGYPTVALRSDTDRSLVRSGTVARMLGWGITKAGTEKQLEDAFSADRLRVGEVPILSPRRCESLTGAHVLGKNAIELCAGTDAGRVDSCDGDSGGPLLVATFAGWVEVGVTSWSADGCGLSEDPGVYASVPAAYQWITQTIAT